MKLASSRSLHLVLVSLAASACVADSLPVGLLSGSSGPDAESSDANPSGDPTAPAATSDAGTTGTSLDPGTGPDTSEGTGLDVADDGLCDVFDPMCPDGLKCMPWSTSGDATWNAWGCFPLDDDPVGVGEACHLLGDPWTGLDDCEEGSMCWNVDPGTLEGECWPFCSGSVRDPVCADPDRFCDISGDGTPFLCAPACDPLAQDCPPGQGCYPETAWWACGPDVSGATGGYGDPCEFLNGCDPGLVCTSAVAVPPGQPCEGASGCCTELCDLNHPLGDAQCVGEAEGQTCQPWYVTAPAGFEDVGVCTL